MLMFKRHSVHQAIRPPQRYLVGLLLMLALVAFLSACNGNASQNETSPTPPPSYPGTPPPVSPGTTPGPGTHWGDSLWDTAYTSVQNDVVSTVEVEVESKDKTATIPPGNESSGWCYSDYTIKVVRYLVDPLPYERITLRVVECQIWPDGTRLPPRWIYYLSSGEHDIIFLSKETHGHFTLSEDEFTLAVGPWAVLPIEGGNVSIMREYHGVEESVNEFIVRLQLYACQDGRNVPRPTDASP
jgi:hypothetical protein